MVPLRVQMVKDWMIHGHMYIDEDYLNRFFHHVLGDNLLSGGDLYMTGKFRLLIKSTTAQLQRIAPLVKKLVGRPLIYILN